MDWSSQSTGTNFCLKGNFIDWIYKYIRSKLENYNLSDCYRVLYIALRNDVLFQA